MKTMQIQDMNGNVLLEQQGYDMSEGRAADVAHKNVPCKILFFEDGVVYNVMRMTAPDKLEKGE